MNSGSHTTRTPVLEIRQLSCQTEQGTSIFERAALVLNEGDIVILQGKSGSGKTTLLKCIAHLNLYEGEVLLHGKSPKSYGIPSYRVKVAYIPQRPSILPGTPRDFLITAKAFKARQQSDSGNVSNVEEVGDPFEVAQAFGIEVNLWDESWPHLSGGESQRIALSIGIGLELAEVLLLDEPTSALDPESSSLVERYLLNMIHSAETRLKAIIWITHSEEQAHKVGTRFVHIIDGKLVEDDTVTVTLEEGSRVV
ncbi:P-loop containing nucleoside triphosphate hydrolase protein [Marasmius fiardii PR-910]|nr:P-loop containing nucleoside triphosphate hydrolase protein [Marasmius fiardii PR-910]